jgi:hypothetical protein
MELCHALSKGGIPSVKIMVTHLGKIGNRTLAQMTEDILTELVSILKTNHAAAIREVIDAI